MKNKLYNYDIIYDIGQNIKNVYEPFLLDEFMSDTIDVDWQNLELKQRMRKVALMLGKYLPSDYKEAIDVLNKVAVNYPDDCNMFALISLSDFVEVYGQNEEDFDLSMLALKNYTKLASSEFAVRPFIINNNKKAMEYLTEWALDSNVHIRRLASEGCRPRLPWGIALTKFKNDPTDVMKILDILKADESLYVRKSVANNLNDISKDNPMIVIDFAKDNYGKNKNTDWILKHGCRTLLKKGNIEVLRLFGFDGVTDVEIDNFRVCNKDIDIGDDLEFGFSIKAKEKSKVRIEYAIDYVKANGSLSRKIFQISEVVMKKGQVSDYRKVQSFKDLSTRKHYAGEHKLTLIVNGVCIDTINFNVGKN